IVAGDLGHVVEATVPACRVFPVRSAAARESRHSLAHRLRRETTESLRNSHRYPGTAPAFHRKWTGVCPFLIRFVTEFAGDGHSQLVWSNAWRARDGG